MSRVLLDSLLVQAALRLSEWIYEDFEKTKDPKETVEEAAQNKLDSENFHIAGSLARLSIEYSLRKIFLAGDETKSQKATVEVTFKTSEKLLERRLFLTFRGTSCAQDWAANMSMLEDEYTFAEEGLAVHSGFHLLLSQAINGIDPSKLMLAAIREKVSQGIEGIVITGHSLGGAMAQIAALKIMQAAENVKDDVQKKVMMDVKCVTFAAPHAFKLLPETHGCQRDDQQNILLRAEQQLHNYIHNNDLVPRLPGFADFIDKVFEAKPLLFEALGTLSGLTPVERGLAALAQQVVKRLPVMKGYISIATSSFIGPHTIEELQKVRPTEVSEYMLKVNHQEQNQLGVAVPATLLSCFLDHKMANYRMYVQQQLRQIEGEMLKLEPLFLPQGGQSSNPTHATHKALEWVSSSFGNRRYSSSSRQIQTLDNEGYFVEVVKLQHERCELQHEVGDWFNPHGYVVLKMKTDKEKELFLRADWDPDGWSMQQKSEVGEFKSYFGSLKASADDAGEVVAEKELTGERAKQALNHLWEIFNDLEIDQPHYTHEWNSEKAAKHVYQSLLDKVDGPGAASKA
mmetsp:Transcript_75307/g.148971  ORF Transcript_75307/g.148971 Transcript_75307/m.148971 type:complete len:571 (+) Transcript_75307:75-1787(+)